MTIYELYDKIGLQQPLIDKLEAVRSEVDLESLNPLIEQLMQRETAAKAHEQVVAAFPEDEGNLRAMTCQLEAVRRQYDNYQRMGISEEIFVETMKCFTRFAEECFVKTGSYYFDRGWWSYRQVSMCLFRIGALEYEFIELDGEKVLSLHIPSDANMKDENVGRSLEEARAFMRRFYPAYADSRMYCNSWLLAPKLQELLPPTSNIVKFQNRFELTRYSDEGNDCLLWVFQAPENVDYHDLKENTSLQRKIKKLMLEGGSVGYGAGFIK